jgi:hypothetical protein
MILSLLCDGEKDLKLESRPSDLDVALRSKTMKQNAWDPGQFICLFLEAKGWLKFQINLLLREKHNVLVPENLSDLDDFLFLVYVKNLAKIKSTQI